MVFGAYTLHMALSLGLGFVRKIGSEYSVTELFSYSNNIRILSIRCAL